MDSTPALSEPFNQASPQTTWIQSYAFKPYERKKLENSNFTYQQQEFIRKTVSTWEAFLAADYDIQEGRYRPQSHDRQPDPSQHKNLYDNLKSEINTDKNTPSIIAQMPAHIQQDKILQLAYLVDGKVDARLQQDEDYDQKTIGRDYIFHPYQTLKNEIGDCDDYAVLKRKMLRDLGVPDDRVYLMAGRDSKTHHMTCVIIGDDGKSYVIDNNPAGKPTLTPLEKYIEHYEFQPMLIMRDEDVMVLDPEDFKRGTPEKKITPASPAPAASPATSLSP